MSLALGKGDVQKEDIATASRFVQVEYLWREILLVEPETSPYEFALKMLKQGRITYGELWDTAEWADRIREDVRLIRLFCQEPERSFAALVSVGRRVRCVPAGLRFPHHFLNPSTTTY
jgi:hypothetical protein